MIDYEKIKEVVADVLSLVDPQKPYGQKLFNAIARVSISVAVEAVCIRRKPATNVIEVLLTQRSPEEITYPGEWHCPGSVMRPGEEIKDVFERLSTKEFGAEIKSLHFVDNFNNTQEARGHFFSVIYLCIVEESPKGTWFPIDKLPSKTVRHHRQTVIPMAVETFVSAERSTQKS